MGGVLVDYTADNATWHYTDDPEIVREIHNVLFCSQEWMALDMGSMTDEQAIMRILPRLSSEKVREIAKATFEHWHEYNIPLLFCTLHGLILLSDIMYLVPIEFIQRVCRIPLLRFTQSKNTNNPHMAVNAKNIAYSFLSISSFS